MIQHRREFGVYHWDTFDNVTLLIEEFDTMEECLSFIDERYKDRIRSDGADQVDIVNQKGKIVRAFKVG